MSFRKELNEASGFLFFIGSLWYKGQFLPFPFLTPIFQVLSCIFYLLGSICWALAFRPSCVRMQWSFNFSWLASEHLYHFLAALTGFVAAAVGLCFLLNPILGIIGVWIYLISSTLWCVAEYNRGRDKNSTEQAYAAQTASFNYALCMTVIALITAISACFPPTFLLLCLSASICMAIGLIGFYFYVQSFEENNIYTFNQSYSRIHTNFKDENTFGIDNLISKNSTQENEKNALSLIVCQQQPKLTPKFFKENVDNKIEDFQKKPKENTYKQMSIN